MRFFLGSMNCINKIVKFLTIIMLFIALIVIVLQVTCRFLHIPLGWTEELARYLIVYVVYFAASLAAREGLLTRLEIAVAVLSSKGYSRHMLNLLFNGIAGIFSIFFYVVVIFCTTYTLRITRGQVSAALEIPMYIPYLGIYAGSFLLTLNTIASFIAPEESSVEGSLSE
ncbi:TRAP transporter small permease [Cloacibacillus evryensis]|uniref:TRAP transporter small permease n=1 Tax=Cloacibacillus evryensis TaxID=508460 RepID=UPI00055058EA|nr:TRAP transporter small permease subunit [Cloacibacillus evryensis]MCQ4764138.1 TRAP transporter small permease subunit [Cloacibacillus evryensis]